VGLVHSLPGAGRISAGSKKKRHSSTVILGRKSPSVGNVAYKRCDGNRTTGSITEAKKPTSPTEGAGVRNPPLTMVLVG